LGAHPDIAKPLKGFGGAEVLELVERNRGDTFRAVYTVRFSNAIIVLHAFQKKSKKGISTPKQEIKLIQNRLKIAEQMYSDWKQKNYMTETDNIFDDLGLDQSDELMARAHLLHQIGTLIVSVNGSRLDIRSGSRV
jgi:phage-related protein